MGCGSSWACKTCRVRFFVGYGSYGRHDERIQRWAPLAEHEGHDTCNWIDDYEWGCEEDTLWGMGEWGARGFPILEGLSTYTYLNLQKERDEAYARDHPPRPVPDVTAPTGNAELDRRLAAWKARQR